MAQSIEEDFVVVPAVEPEAHFFEVSGEMLRTDFVPASPDGPLPGSSI
jgi:hypothetical protein